MKGKIMKILLISVIILAGIVVALVALTYPQYNREMSATKDHIIAGSEIFTTDQGDIEYAVTGEGIPVLFLHGAGGGYDQGLWGSKVYLGDGYKFVSVSRYGFLRSPIPVNASIKTQAALYKELLDYLEIEKVVVIGVSAGGPSATQFANDYPERVSTLILVSAVSMRSAPGDKDPFFVNIIHTIQQSDYAYWIISKNFQSQFLDLLGVPSDVYQTYTSEQKILAQEMLDVMHPMTQRHKGTINDGKMIELDDPSTENLSAPTLIIHAKDDALVSYEHAENAHRRIKQSELILFDTGGHAMLSQLDEIRKLTNTFVNESI
jgi:pimeloyl-ACP methyl ester carboxylesterase